MVTTTRVRIVAAVAGALFLFPYAGKAGAQGVPRHLASMAKDVLAGGALDKDTGDPKRDAIRQRARKILKRAGARYWARDELRQRGAAAATGKALGMDISKPDQWAKLRAILGESRRDKQIDQLRQWGKDTGKPTKGPEFEKLIAKFDNARTNATKNLARSHRMEVGEQKDRLQLNWDRVNNKFEIWIRAKETSQGAEDGFDLQLNGDVTAVPAIKTDDTILAVRHSKSPINVVTNEELRRLKGAVFGKWRDGYGRIWEIASSKGGPGGKDAAKSPRARIAELERQLARIWSDKVFRWKNTDTGDVVVQNKFKRLKGPFKYQGQDYRRADAKEAIARLQKQIVEARSGPKRLPVDSSDPIGMGDADGGETQPLRIRVKDTDGHSWTFDSAVLSLGRITAKRTLRNVKDIARHLPMRVRHELVRAWSPPEWIELAVRVEGETRQVYMTGQRWRLRVSYSPLYNDVSRIHTPYPQSLRLERAGVKVAQGAAKNQKP